MSAKWALGVSYALALLVPLVGIGALSSHEIDVWLSTGMCPAGPMDRPAAPCGLVDLFTIVFLGGWAAFIVVPVLAAWALGCTAVWAAAWTFVARRARSVALDQSGAKVR